MAGGNPPYAGYEYSDEEIDNMISSVEDQYPATQNTKVPQPVKDAPPEEQQPPEIAAPAVTEQVVEEQGAAAITKVDFGKSATNDPAGFAEALKPIVTRPDFVEAPLGDKIDVLNTLSKSKAWNKDVDSSIRELATNFINNAPPEQMLDYSALVPELPVTPKGEDPVKATNIWRENAEISLLKKGINPNVFGDGFYNYLDSAAQSEIAAYEIRNRGAIASVRRPVTDFARDMLTGAVSEVAAEPAAGIIRLGTANTSTGKAWADYLEKLPQELLTNPDLDYLYEVDENGRVIMDYNNNPIEKSTRMYAQGVGAVAGALAGGVALKGASMSARAAGNVGRAEFLDKALTAGMLSIDGISAANESFKVVYDNTDGDLTKSYTAALWSAGAAVATEGITDLAIVGKLASPGVSGLSKYNQAKHLGKHVLQGAALGAAGNVGADIAAQGGEMYLGGTEFSPERAQLQGIFGGIGGAAGGAMTGIATRNTQPYIPLQPVPAPQAPGQATLPAPETRLGLPAPSTSTVVSPETTTVIPLYQPKSVEDQVNATQLLEKFEDSWEPQAVMSVEDAQNIDPAILDTLGITISPRDGSTSVVVTQESNHVPIEGVDTLEGITQQIEALQKDISDGLTKEDINSGATAEQLSILKTELKQAEAARKEAVANEPQVQQESVQVYNRLVAAQKRVQDLRNERSRADSEEERIILGEDINLASKDLADAEAAWDAVPFKRVGELTNRISELNRQIQQATENGYAKTRALKNGNLAQLVEKRRQLASNTANATPAFKTSYRGIEVNGNRVIPYKGKWYSISNDGKSSAGYTDFKTLLQSLEKPAAVASTQFVTTVEVSPQPVRAERPKKTEVVVEKPKRGRKAKQTTEQKTTAKDLNDVLLEDDSTVDLRIRKATSRADTTETDNTNVDDGTEVSLSEEDSITDTEDGIDNPPVTEERTTNVEDDTVEARKRKKQPPTEGRVTFLTPKEGINDTLYTKPVTFTRTSTKPVTRRQIFETATDLVRAFSKGFLARTNSKMPKHVLGTYNSIKNFAAVKGVSDISTFLHEAVGHAIDAAVITKWERGAVADFSRIPPNVKAAAEQTALDWYPGGLDNPITTVKEGLAIFLQNHLSGNRTHKEILAWYESTFKNENPDVYKALEKIREMVFDFQNQTPELFIDNNVVLQKPEKDSVKSRAYKAFTQLRDNYESASQVLREMSPRLKKLWDANQYRAEKLSDVLVNTGVVDLNSNLLISMSLKEAVSPAKGSEVELGRYLSAKKGLVMIKDGMASGADSMEWGDTISNIEKLATSKDPAVARKYQGIIKAANNLWDMNTLILENLATTSPAMEFYVKNLIKANLELTGTKHGYYAPRGVTGKKGKSNSTKALTGTQRAIINPLKEYKRAYKDLYKYALENQFKFALISDVGNGAINSPSILMREITDKKRLAKIKAKHKSVVDTLVNPDASALERMLADIFIPGFDEADTSILTYKDGNVTRYFDTDMRILGLFNDTLPEIMLHPGMQALRLTAGVFRVGATTYRAPYQIANGLIRDPLAVARYIQNDSSYGMVTDVIRTYANLLASIPDVVLYDFGLNKNGWAAAADRMGTYDATSLAASRNIGGRETDSLITNTVEAVIDYVNTASAIGLSVLEKANRVNAVRMRAKQLGIKDPNAPLTVPQQIDLIVTFKESSTNYTDQGRYTRNISQVLPFFGGRIADLARIPRDFKRNPEKLAAYFIGMSLFGFYHGMAFSDEEWWQETALESLFNRINLPVNINGVNKLLQIPMDTVTQAAFSLGQAFSVKVNEMPDRPVSLVTLGRTWLGEFSPINNAFEALPPVVRAALQQKLNRVAYWDKPIVSPTMARNDPEEQYNEYTTGLAKNLGRITGMSPLRIDQGLRDVFPASVEYLRALDMAVDPDKNLPENSGGNFWLGALLKSGSREGIYDRSYKAFEKKFNKYSVEKDNETPRQAEFRKYLNRLNNDVTDLNVAIRNTRDQEFRDELKKARTQIYRKGAAVTEENFVANDTGKYKYVGDKARAAEKEKRKKKQND